MSKRCDSFSSACEAHSDSPFDETVMAKHTDADAKTPGDKPDAPALNFVQDIIEEHNKNGRFGGRVHTRFPPEPNGYLHIGHAKSIWLNYGLAVKYGGRFNLRYDDTNPTAEEQEYVDSITRGRPLARCRLGESREFYASDYFDRLYEWAEKLIREGKAYVDDLPRRQDGGVFAAMSRNAAGTAQVPRP